MAVEVLTREERVARARLALARAELRTGARSAEMVRSEVVRPEVVRREVVRPEVVRPEAMHEAAADASPPQSPPQSLRGPRADVLTTALLTTERPALPVPPALAPLLPDGLRRGATTAVLGSTSLALAVLAAASAAGAWVAVVGQPTFGLLAAAEAGVDLTRLAVVPSPGADAATVLGALVDGMDAVVVGPRVALVDADRRRLSARARERGATLLPTVAWPGADVVLTADPVGEHGGWRGVGAGQGRLRTQQVRVARSGRRGAAVPLSLVLTLPLAAPDGIPEDPRRQPVPTASALADRPDLRLVG
ncbi:hypothetical protein [Cellulomonas persica]|uniref:Uncharacterized protein n=1 Tax=Cellulomonas persica TaxID=76861 RepID=A0A510UVW2_9CELL|nr:hypothetical protein [Cellulomonas persica]GEK18646.1 hypothetical protein CPE01_23790 [Cellulomonas persica]